jgi:hypothetical protein
MRTLVRLNFLVVASLLCAAKSWGGQSGQFLEHAVIDRTGDQGTVTCIANDPRPLLQALDAISVEYGWSIDYEDPPYQSSLELAEVTDAKWRAANPTTPAFRLVRGGSFRTTYSESPDTATSDKERATIIRKLVADYNASGNPGQFTVRENAGGRLEINGSSVRDERGAQLSKSSILDTPITVPTASKNAAEAVGNILKALNAKTKTKVGIGILPDNRMMQTQVKLAVTEMPARDALHQVLAQVKGQLYWRLLYDAGMQAYFFSVLDARRVQYDTFGHRQLIRIN